MAKIKKIIKSLLPPFLFQLLKKALFKEKTWKPKWVTLDYKPLNNIKIFLDPSGPWQEKIINDSYDTFSLHRLKEMDLDGKVFYDIGAHIGVYSFYLSRLLGKNGAVHAFEPNPANIERMTQIRDANNDMDNMHIHQIALSDQKGEIEFMTNNNIESGRSSGGFISDADTIWNKAVYKHKGFVNTKSKTIQLDAIENELGIKRKPDIMKIDVEGAEYQVLKGAQETIEKYKPIIIMEVHSIKSMHDVIGFLNSHSYKTEIIYEEGDGRCFMWSQAQ